MRRHADQQMVQHLEQRSGDRAERGSASGVSTVGSSKCVSEKARPWPGMCFMTGSTPPEKQAFNRGTAEGSYGFRILAVGAQTDDVAGALDRHIEHRQAVGGDAEAQEIEGVQPRQQPARRAGPASRSSPIERADRSARRIVGGDRRTQALRVRLPGR